METLIRFNDIQNMADVEVLEKYDVPKTSILKYLFVEMKTDIVNTDVKDFFSVKKKVSVLSDEDKKKKTSYSKARKRAKLEVDKMIASGKKMSDEEQKAAVKKRHDEYYAEFMK